MKRISTLLILSALLVMICVFVLTQIIDSNQIPVINERNVQVTQNSELMEKPVIRIAVAAMISPRDTSRYYQRMLQYLGEQIGHSVELVQRKTYAEVNEMLLSGGIDLAFICSGPYALASAPQAIPLLATPLVQGSHLYYSYLIVHMDSNFTRLEDLQGKRFAFTDPDSNTGFIVPSYWLSQLSTTPDKFFEKTIFTYSHDNSIMSVAKGLVDGASVDSLIWDYYARTKPEFTEKTRILFKSEGYGIPPVVASPFINDAVKTAVSNALLSMHMNPEGEEILKALFIDAFVTPNSDWYASIRAMHTTIHPVE